jgi:UDPglucose--hexose-1-phosphate uridylyltransferase
METRIVKKTVTELADGRELMYFDAGDAEVRTAYPDLRRLDPVDTTSQTRLDPVLGEWVVVAEHRQGRTYLPPAGSCPLCPSRDGWLSEIPAPDYEVAVFENRFPSFSGKPADSGVLLCGLPHHAHLGGGRCEVVCFTSDHDATFAALGEARAALVLEAWTDRTAELGAMPGIRQIYCFENRGIEIGVTLTHPHGQIYAFPFVPPKTTLAVANARAHRASTGRNLFEDLLAAERAAERVVIAGEHWTAFVPFAARWPYEVHLYPHRRVADFTGLDDAQRAEFPAIYLELLRRFDRLFVDGRGSDPRDPDVPAARTPYIAAWHQAPTRPVGAGTELALHLELFTVRRTADKLKNLAGTESGMGAFMNDVSPETAARRLQEVAS